MHYCVTNMPGACARTSTQALTNATCSYALELAQLGYKAAFKEQSGLRNGLNVCQGFVTNEQVAHESGYSYYPPEKFLQD